MDKRDILLNSVCVDLFIETLEHFWLSNMTKQHAILFMTILELFQDSLPRTPKKSLLLQIVPVFFVCFLTFLINITGCGEKVLNETPS